MSGRIGKIDGSLFSDHKDTEHFRAGETVAIHDQINGQISQSVLYLAAGGERIAVVYQKNTIYNIQLLKLRQNFGAHGHGDEKAGAAQLLAKREQADQTDLLCCAHDHRHHPGTAKQIGLIAGASLCYDGQKDMGGDCGRNPGIETGFKEDAVPVHLQLASVHIHALYLLNHKRRQVQGDERADFISRLENAKGGMARADFLYNTGQSTARACDGILHFAPHGNNAADFLNQLSGIVVDIQPQLRKAGGIDIQSFHANEKLVFKNGKGCVQFPGQVGQCALRVNAAMGTEWTGRRPNGILHGAGILLSKEFVTYYDAS